MKFDHNVATVLGATMDHTILVGLGESMDAQFATLEQVHVVIEPIHGEAVGEFHIETKVLLATQVQIVGAQSTCDSEG